MKIKKVVIIGSGTMGSGIAAHLCNANIPVTLLDLKTESRGRILETFLNLARVRVRLRLAKSEELMVIFSSLLCAVSVRHDILCLFLYTFQVFLIFLFGH